MPNTESKLPVGIVNEIINKIASFTKEIELLRSKLASKEDIDNKIDDINKKLLELTEIVSKTLVTIKAVFTVTIIAVGLSFIGAQFISWYQTKNLSPYLVKQEKREKVMSNIESDSQKRSQEKLDKILKKLDDLKDTKQK